jgi:hypothetical protein
VRRSRQINAAVSTSKLESLHLAVSQFGGCGIGARLGLSLGAAPFTNSLAAEGIFDYPRFVPVTTDLLRAEAHMHPHGIAFYIE